MFQIATDIKDTWLPELISSDGIYPPTEYDYVAIECNPQQNLIE